MRVKLACRITRGKPSISWFAFLRQALVVFFSRHAQCAYDCLATVGLSRSHTYESHNLSYRPTTVRHTLLRLTNSPVSYWSTANPVTWQLVFVHTWLSSFPGGLLAALTLTTPHMSYFLPCRVSPCRVSLSLSRFAFRFTVKYTLQTACQIFVKNSPTKTAGLLLTTLSHLFIFETLSIASFRIAAKTKGF